MNKKLRWKTKSGLLTMKINHGKRPGILMDRGDFQINPIAIIKNLFANWQLIACTMAIVMILAAGIIYMVPNQYTSTASLLPSGKADNLSTLKELAGIGSMSISIDENSSILFPNILRSRQIKDAVLSKTYLFADNNENYNLTLGEYFDTRIPSYLYKNLDKITSIEQNKKTGVIALAVETEYPQFSQAILQVYLDELEYFNSHKRISSAKENARYLEREVVKIENNLRLAENKLESYQMANRSWDMTTDPEILKNLSQLERDIAVKTETFAFVQGQFELAKLEVQKDIPIIRILDNPSLPQIKSSPRRIMTVAASGAAAFFIIAFILTTMNAIRHSKENLTERIASQTIVNRTNATIGERV